MTNQTKSVHLEGKKKVAITVHLEKKATHVQKSFFASIGNASTPLALYRLSEHLLVRRWRMVGV